MCYWTRLLWIVFNNSLLKSSEWAFRLYVVLPRNQIALSAIDSSTPKWTKVYCCRIFLLLQHNNDSPNATVVESKQIQHAHRTYYVILHLSDLHWCKTSKLHRTPPTNPVQFTIHWDVQHQLYCVTEVYVHEWERNGMLLVIPIVYSYNQKIKSAICSN